MSVTLARLTGEEVIQRKRQIAAVYGAAFEPPPYLRTPLHIQAFADTLDTHVWRRDFRCFVAEDERGTMVGFTYGYTAGKGQWWFDVVARGMEAAAARFWLADTYEFVELAVVPQSQGQGIGRRLHDAALDGLPHRTAVLSTIQEHTIAQDMYRRYGWVDLMENYVFPGVPEPYLIMGIDLIARQDRRANLPPA